MRTESALGKTLKSIFPRVKRICIITNAFPPCPKSSTKIAIGGIFRKYERFVDELKYQKIRFCVISLYYENITRDQDSPDVYRIGVYKPYTTSSRKYLYPLLEFFNPSIFIRCLKVLMRQRPDLVILGENLGMSLAPILAAKLLGIKVVIQHDWLCPLSPRGQACDFATRVSKCGGCLEESFVSKQNRFAKFSFGVFSAIMLLIKRNLWNRCVVFAEGDYFKSFYVESGIRPERIWIVPPSPTVADFSECDQTFMRALEERLGNAYVMAYVGRLSHGKGIDLLLKSYKILKEQIKEDIKFVVAGDGALRDVLVGEAKRESGILYSGWLSTDKLKCVYLLADIVVIPSILPEAYPNVALEALSFGKRVIGFQMGGLKEIAEKNSSLVLVENIDPSSLAGAIMREYHAR